MMTTHPHGGARAALAFVLIVAAGTHAAAAASPARRPNILVCLADDWGWPHAPEYGDRVVKTPSFDRIAREGVLFNFAFCPAPSCTPARAGLLTGQWIHRLEDGANLNGTLSNKFAVYPDMLEAAGYFVGMFGKGWAPGDYAAGGWKRNPAGPEFKDFAAFLKARPKDQPFCYWFGSHDPHRIYVRGSGVGSGLRLDQVQVPPYLPDTPDVRSDICDYYFEVERFDRDVGEHLRLLAEAGELDNTIVVVTGDNGWPFPHGKADVYDAGMRVPLAIRWPGHVPAGTVIDQMVNFTDLTPTFLIAAGLKPPTDMTGRNLWPLLEGGRWPWPNRMLVERERHAAAREGNLGYPSRGLRTPDFLYIHNYRPDRWPMGDPEPYLQLGRFGDIDGDDKYPTWDYDTKSVLVKRRYDPDVAPFYELNVGKRPGEELYDLAKDPYQLHNVAADPSYASTRAKLREELDQWLRESGDPRAMHDDDTFDHYTYFFPSNPGARFLSHEDMNRLPPDFRARVRMVRQTGPGPIVVVHEGFKSDLAFQNDPEKHYLIWPKFLDGNLQPLPDGADVPQTTLADFWIGNPGAKPSLLEAIKVGTRFWMSDGAKIVGEVEVTELLAGAPAASP